MRKISLPVGSPPSQETSTLTLTGECVFVLVCRGEGSGGSRKMERQDQRVVKKRREVKEKVKGGGREEEWGVKVFSPE